MKDVPPFRSTSDFVRNLVNAAKVDAPAVGAKGRALAGLSAAGAVSATTVAAVGAASGAVRTSRVSWSACAMLATATAAGAAAGWTLHAPPAPDARVLTEAPRVVKDAPPSAPAPAPSAMAAMIAAPHNAPDSAVAPSICSSVELPEHEPTVCSQGGHAESMELVNTCGETIDLFWVDFKCRETFTARLAPGETERESTFDTHPWRIRDHATHRLLKEWVGPRVPASAIEASDAPVHPPDVLIKEGQVANDVAPMACARAGSRAALRFVNQRTQGVSVIFRVDVECHEYALQRIEPGDTWTAITGEGVPWRVRDENGTLLVDYVPDAPDNIVYVTLP